MIRMLAHATGSWLRRPGQATTWAQDMLRPGIAVIVTIARRPDGIDDVAVIDQHEQNLVHGPLTAIGSRTLRELIHLTADRILLAYNADGVRARLLVEAARRDIDPQHLEDPDRWGCVMHARSAALGTPDHLYPLGAVHDAIAAAWTVLDLVREIAEQRCPAVPGLPDPATGWMPGRSVGR